MANEGIMALPGGMDMPAEKAQNDVPSVRSADSYDAAKTALGMVNPGEDQALTAALREKIQGLQITPEQISILIQIFEYVSQHPGEYRNLLQKMIESGALDKGDMPEEYDPEFIGAILAVLHEMQTSQGQGAMEPVDLGPVVEGLQPMGMAEGGLADVASYLAGKGRGGDSILAHITPEEAAMLKRHGGSGTINPATGLPEFKGGVIGGIVNAVTGVVKSVVEMARSALASPVGRILGTVALATVLGPAGMGLSLGTAAGVAGAGTTLLAGGSMKDALVAGALGYVGGGGTIMGASPVSAVGNYMSGIAPVGSALNTGLATGVLGAGIGKLSGMSTADALRMGAMSGASAAALQGLKSNTSLLDEGRVTAQDILKEGTPAEGTGRFSGMNQTGNIGAAGEIGTTGTAKDILGGGLKVPGASTAGLSYDAASGTYKPDYSVFNPGSGAAAPGMEGAGSGLRPGTVNLTGAPGMEGALGAGVRPNTAFGAGDLSRAAGGTGLGTNYSMSPAPAAAPASAQPTGFMDKMLSGAKDLYGEYLSPSRPGVGPDAGFLTKYGPMMGAGLAATAALGGFKKEPVNQNPLYNRDYTGFDFIRDNPDKFRGGLEAYQPPSSPSNPIVPTPSYATIPVGAPGMITPGGISASPAGVAQPYNMAGLYGVPLIYGPDGRPQRLAKGGIPEPTNFPRKTGPISGPGTGTSDDIPAMLSDGEFVFTAKAVRNAGGGSRRKGAARMYKLMKKLEGGVV